MYYHLIDYYRTNLIKYIIKLTTGINDQVLGASLEFRFGVFPRLPDEVVEIQTATENRCSLWLQGD